MFALNNLQQQSNAWIWYVILIILLLVIVIWWWLSRRRGVETKTPYQAPVQEKKDTPDDLTKIEGIGPKVAKVLNDAGITTFGALANANAADIQKRLNMAGLQMMNPEGWIEQAALAAKGDWAALEKLQAELKGGRRK